MAGNDKEKIRETVAKITAGHANDLDKIKAIYYFVQDKIRYIAFEEGYSGYIPSSAQAVLDNKYGDCKGMANLLTEMLKLSGYDAHFTWIGTRAIPYPQSMLALCVNNHAITTSDLNNREIPVTISGDIILKNLVQTIEGNKYINLDFFPKTLDRYMPDEKRTNGYDFDYVLSYEDEFPLTLPQGSKFSDIPEKLELKYDGFEFRGEYTVSGNKII